MPQPPSIVVILNPAAGDKTQAKTQSEVNDLFRTFGYEPEVVLLRADQTPEVAARAASARASIVVAGGGDGTVSGVAAGVMGTQAALGILPLGTFNHFAKDLHIPLDLRAAVEVIVAQHLDRVDVGEVNGHVFINNSSIGIYPNIVEEREALRRRGHRKWPAMAIATFRVVRRHRGVTVRIKVDGVERTWRTPFVFVGNNEYAIDGVGLGARTRLDEGTLYAYLTPRTRARYLPVLVVKALLGRASQSGEFEIVPATELTIDMPRTRRIHVAVDGEVSTMIAPLRYRACPRSLPVVIPRA
jgi:diacylglycerol kinase family enzyme